MRAAFLTALALALAFAPSAGAAATVRFHAPAQWSGDAQMPNAHWALFVMAPPDAAAGTIGTQGPTEATYWTAVKPHAENAVFGYDVPNALPPSTQDFPDAFAGNLSFTASTWKSLLVRADSVQVSSGDSSGRIATIGSDGEFETALPAPNRPVGTVRVGIGGPGADSVLLNAGADRPASWMLNATGSIHLEFLNGTIECAGPCPQPRSSDGEAAPGVGGGVERLEYLSLEFSGHLVMTGQATGLAVGNTSLTANIRGSLRLPGLQMSSCSQQECVSADGETLRSTGSLRLEEMAWRPGTDVQGRLGMDSGSVRLDEHSVAAEVFGSGLVAAATATTAALGVGLWFAVKSLTPFFTRIREPEALRDPKRRALFDAIAANPGVSYNQLIVSLSIPKGTARHHLHVLENLGLIETRAFRNTLCHYPRGVRGDRQMALAAVQDPTCRAIADLVRSRGALTQAQIITAFDDSHPRSTIQFKIRKLVETGVLSAKFEHGKSMSYREAHSSLKWNPSPE